MRIRSVSNTVRARDKSVTPNTLCIPNVALPADFGIAIRIVKLILY